MIKIEKTEVMGWEPTIRGMRNPLNSWSRSDSDFSLSGMQTINGILVPTIGPNDADLMRRLCKAGPSDAKFRRMLVVYADITAPLYWWKEYDTYKVGTVANSCSTMHKIHAAPFTVDDFSCEHITLTALAVLHAIIDELNYSREVFLETNDKVYWWNMIQLLPTSYNQKRTVEFNYEVLHNIYHSRLHHKLDEWHAVCRWIESLPYSWIITGKENTNGKA